MELSKLFFGLLLLQGTLAASYKKQARDIGNEAFTSELAEGFYVTQPKSDIAQPKEEPVQAPPVKEPAEDKVQEDGETPVEIEVSIENNQVKDGEEDAKPTTTKPSSDGEKQEVSEESDTVPQPPNIFQQGLATLQQGIQNITSGISSIIRPANDSSSPPNILQNLQQSVQQGFQSLNQTFQNIVNPAPSNSTNFVQQGITNFQQGVQQGISNLQQGVQQGIQNLTVAFQNFVNRTSSDDANGTSPGFLQQSIQNLQQGVQTGLTNLNQTFQELTNPSDDSPNIIQNITSGIQTAFNPTSSDPADSTSAPPTFVQQTINNLQTALQTGINNLNTTLQNILNPSQTSNSGDRPNFIQTISDGIQNLFRPRPSSSTQENVRQQFGIELGALNNTLHEGIQNITQHILATA